MKKIFLLLTIVVFQQSFAQTFSNFVAFGNQNQYVPVVFRSTTADGGNRTFFISRLIFMKIEIGLLTVLLR